MVEDVAQIETRPAEPNRNEKPYLVPTHRNDDRSQQKDQASNDRQVREAFPAPLPRWPCVYRKLKLGRSGGEVRQGWRVI
jgi:membrane fusion protein, multidrug efflux system